MQDIDFDEEQLFAPRSVSRDVRDIDAHLFDENDFRAIGLPDHIIAYRRTLDALPKADRDTITGQVKTREASLRETDNKIAQAVEWLRRITDLRNNLIVKRRVEEKNIRLCYSLLSSVRLLPQDVLSEIFYCCVCEYSSDMERTGPSMLVTLCQVCSLWRNVALRMPRLWADLAFACQLMHDDEDLEEGEHEGGYGYGGGYGEEIFPFFRPSLSSIFAGVPRSVKTWFSRAGCLPLSLHVALTSPSDETSPQPHETSTMSTLFASFPYSRLRRLALQAPYRQNLDFLRRLPSLEALESLSILCCKHLDGDAKFRESVLRNSPRLRRALLHNYLEPMIFSPHVLPWANLTQVYVNAYPFDLLNHVLRQCANLQRGYFYHPRKYASENNDDFTLLFLDMLTENMAPPNVVPPNVVPPNVAAADVVTLHHLTDLVFGGDLYDGQIAPFSGLTFPILETFVMGVKGDPGEGRYTFNLSSVQDGLSYASMTCLRILGNLDVDMNELSSLLGASPCLEELSLSVDIDYTILFCQITPGLHQSSYLLPNLENLFVHFAGWDAHKTRLGEDHFPSSLLTRFIESRWWIHEDQASNSGTLRPAERLRHLSLSIPSTTCGDAFFYQIKEFSQSRREEGLSLVWSTSSKEDWIYGLGEHALFKLASEDL